MKTLLLCLAAFALPLSASFEQPEECDELPYDWDLFRKEDQVMSGHVDFLYWTVNESCLDYALKMQHSAWGPDPSYAQGIAKKGTFDWDPGVRVSLSYYRSISKWSVIGSYTRLTTRGENHASKPETDTKFLTGTWPQIVPAPLAGATSHLHMNYNVADVLIAYHIYPNFHLRLRMIGGIPVVWIDQDWKVRYVDSSLNNTVIRNRWKYVGAGMKLGMWVDWYWGLNVYITGRFATSVYMGDYKNQSRQTTNFQPNPSDNTSIPIRDLHYQDARPAFSAQALFGPSWQKNCSKSRLELFVGYEYTLWANLNQIFHSTSGGPFAAKETWINSSMTGMQGLTARVSSDF